MVDIDRMKKKLNSLLKQLRHINAELELQPLADLLPLYGQIRVEALQIERGVQTIEAYYHRNLHRNDISEEHLRKLADCINSLHPQKILATDEEIK